MKDFERADDRTIAGRYGVSAEIFDYLDRESEQLAFAGGRYWDFGSDGIHCLVRCKKLSLSFSIGRWIEALDGRQLYVGDPADPIYRGPLTLESAQNAVMVLKMLEDDDRRIP
jgi:hypothetical protein